MLGNVTKDSTFIKRIITGDETCVYEFDVETVQKTSEFRSKSELNRKKPKGADGTEGHLSRGL